MMLFWKLIGSERRVQAAMDASVGYDISPNIIQMPANTNETPVEEEGGLSLWKDYSFAKDSVFANKTSVNDDDVWGSVRASKKQKRS